MELLEGEDLAIAVISRGAYASIGVDVEKARTAIMAWLDDL